MRWFHRKVVGHPTRYEQECMAYNWAKYGSFSPTVLHDPIGGRSLFNPKAVRKLEFKREYLGEPIPPESVTKTVIP